jgi:hypothetical protein
MSFSGCTGDKVCDPPLDSRIEERVIEIVRARGRGIVKEHLGLRR